MLINTVHSLYVYFIYRRVKHLHLHSDEIMFKLVVKQGLRNCSIVKLTKYLHTITEIAQPRTGGIYMRDTKYSIVIQLSVESYFIES